MDIKRSVTKFGKCRLNLAGAASAILISAVLACALFAAGAPDRNRGISIQMFPKSIAGLFGKKWGLAVNPSKFLKPESELPVLQSTGELLNFVRKQDKDVQANGVWIVTTNPDAYSDSEKKLLQDIQILCHRERIVLFLSRTGDSPGSWKRFD